MVLPTEFESVTYNLEGCCSGPIELRKLLFDLVRPTGIEPASYGL